MKTPSTPIPEIPEKRTSPLGKPNSKLYQARDKREGLKKKEKNGRYVSWG